MWSYTGNPESRDLDMVRFLIGDTNADDPLLSDEEIGAAISVRGSAVRAALMCANALAAKFTGLVDKSIGDLSISYSQKAKNFRDLSMQLRAHAVASLPPYSTGMSTSEKEANEDDTDLVKPFFKRGMHDYVTSEGTE